MFGYTESIYEVSLLNRELELVAPPYDEMDRLANRRLHASNYDGVSAVTLSSVFNYLQSMDYTYNIRSWMTDINNVSSCSIQSGDQLADMFKLQLSYDAPTGGGTAQYNGNISTMQWGTYINSTCLPQQQYRLSYDAADRITSADHWTNSGSWVNTNNYSESNITYDLNGNIRTYTRRGLTVAPSTYGIIDQLTYSYGDAVRPDLLTDVQDAGSLTKGFVDNASSGTNYLYDADGNLMQDVHKTMVFTYNHVNLPNSLVKDGISNVTWTYTADGEKLTKVGPGGTRNYVTGIEYLGANTDAIYHAEGRCMPNGSSWYYDYTLKDHLGDARVNFRANGTAVTHLEDFHYYPFGMQIEGLGTILSTGNDYRYNGKELNEDYSLNWYDYGARWYDPAVGRWASVDPMSIERNWMSIYNYTQNNPINRNDPTGALDEGPGDPPIPSPAGILYETYLQMDAAVFNFMAKGAEALGFGETGVNIRKETKFDENGAILGNEIVKSPEGTWGEAILETTADLLAIVPGANKLKQLGIGLAVVETPAKNAAVSELKGAAKGSLSGTKEALIETKKRLGLGPSETLPKGKQGKFGSPQRGDSVKGYRLDPSHPNAKPGSGEEYPHFNLWDFTTGKRNCGGTSNVVSIKK